MDNEIVRLWIIWIALIVALVLFAAGVVMKWPRGQVFVTFGVVLNIVGMLNLRNGYVSVPLVIAALTFCCTGAYLLSIDRKRGSSTG